MATANVTVKIEGLNALREFVERLEQALERTEEIGRPLYGDIHITSDTK